MVARFQFVMRSGPTPDKVFPLEGPEIIIGRENTCSVTINDAEISRKHSRLIWQGSGYVIEDCGSTNGTFVNGQRLTNPFTLQGNESISLGENIVLVFESTVDPNATVMSTSASSIKKAVEEAKQKSEAPQAVAATPAPVQTPPAPAKVQAPVSSFSGQVPANPPPRKPAPTPAPKKSNKMVIFLIVALILLCICGVLAYFIYSYLSTAPASFWCENFSFYFKPELYPQCIP
jgi:pSer/pThr/pTyr-binding forkhead associated (FHA) protein